MGTLRQFTMDTCAYFLLFILIVICIGDTVSKCSHGQWQCDSGECVLRENVCNTRADCADGSDESTCKTKVCEDFLFQCENKNQCLSRVNVCNGQVDCEDGSDEEQPDCDREDFVHVENSKHNSAQSMVVTSKISLILLFSLQRLLF